MNAIRARIREATGRDKMAASVDSVVVGLNLVLRGWAAYFRNGTSSRKFTITDSYVQERLAIFDSAKHGRTGRNWLSHDKCPWPWQCIHGWPRRSPFLAKEVAMGGQGEYPTPGSD
jgi:RNA-directed DNA polymerase